MSTIVPERDVLPSYVKPLHYAISLEPSFETFKFDGHVKVDLDVNNSTSELLLNSLDIDIRSAFIQVGDSSRRSTDIIYDAKRQTVLLKFDEQLKANSKATLSMAYQGTLNDIMAGFYRSSYIAEDGSKKWIATTQMEPTDCRRALPCWDEPALKATWDIEITAEKSLTVLSNMDVKHEAVKGERKTTTFNTTPVMSSYLLAFVVGDFRHVQAHTAGNVPVRVYSTPGNEHLGQFSVDLAAKTLDFFGESFGSPYPLPKMDMVAIPDFSAGAMENWGLVTYRVVDLLIDEKTVNAATKQRVAEVVQHELAHQWFGNLVTMDFWDGLWLNEGFATWMSWYSCNKFFPEWKVWESYVTDDLQSALQLDGLRSSHPIEVPVKSAEEVNQIFDAISYSKGSCVIRMISQILGEETFLKGIRLYLKRHAYGNTQTGDLWSALTEASGVDVSRIANIWTKKIGYPVLKVEEGDEKIVVHQNRFLTTGDVKPSEDETLYWIPLGFKTLGSSGTPEVAHSALTKRSESFNKKDISNDFFKFNANHSGIYRVAYSPERLAKLSKQAQELKGALGVEDRTGLVADAGALAASGYAKTSSLLTLVKNWSKEESYVVWDEMLSRIDAVKSAWMFEPDTVQKSIKAFGRSLAGPKARSLGWTFVENESHIMAQFKARLFSAACAYEDKEVVQEAQEMFKQFTAGNKTAIHPNLRSTVFAMAIEHGGEKEWETVRNTYLHPSSTEEKYTALRALGRTRVPSLIRKTLDMSFSDEVKEQDLYMPYQGLRTHPDGAKALWKFAKDNWSTLEKKLPPGLSMLSSVLQIVTTTFSSQEAIDDIQSYFRKRDTSGYDKGGSCLPYYLNWTNFQGLAQSLDTIRGKASWLKRDREDVQAWLKQNKY